MLYLNKIMTAGPKVLAWKEQLPKILAHDKEVLINVKQNLQNGLIELETRIDSASTTCLLENLSQVRSVIRDFYTDIEGAGVYYVN